ncbi:hypothetical protein GCM10027271_51160 [Saccharopolyspora gloriosae]
MPVRWRAAPDELIDHWENIHESTTTSTALPLSGHFTAVRQTYEIVRSKRLVILGQAGAGKTTLAHRLVLDLLAAAASAGPVPVLFSLSGWKPVTTPLPDWLADRLARDFPFLNAPGSSAGANAASELVDRNLILPVLDGFDEIPERNRPQAIDEITEADGPLVLTSRTVEYAAATRAANVVGRAAAIELEDLDLDETRQYLILGTNKSRSVEWDAVFEHLNEAPSSPVGKNLIPPLTAPLMVMLARVIYGASPDRRPGELLDAQKFPTRRSVENHLLRAYLDVSYGARRGSRPQWSPGQVRKWMGNIAAQLSRRDAHDLVWWDLAGMIRPCTRVFVTAGSYGMVYSISYWITEAIEHQIAPDAVGGITYELAGRQLSSLAGAVLFGVAGGLALGVVVETGFRRGRTGPEPERLRLTLRRGDKVRPLASSRLTKLSSSFVKGVAFGIMFGVVFVVSAQAASGAGPLALKLVSDIGLVVGLAGGLGNLAMSFASDNHHSQAASPWALLRTDRRVTLFRVFVVGGIVAAVFTVGVSISAGLLLGLLTGAATLALSAWGHWLLFARFWLPLTGRLPWRPRRFLEDAYDRGVLRQAGAVYQFRHAHLRDHLARRRPSQRWTT